MSEILVSAVIPVFNGERYLRDCLESALAQTHTPVEVIVVNDGSTDATAGILDEYSDRIQVIHQENLGQETEATFNLFRQPTRQFVVIIAG